MKYTSSALIGFALVTASASSCFGADVPKFGKTCLGKVTPNTNVCLSSNGKSLSSTFNWRGRVPTRGNHTGCSASGSTIKCSGGFYSTSQGSGQMGPVSVTVSNGKPTSLRWK